ncbi:MAG: LLM class F420-dependent oxidoreductase [Chloroflexi bacterium]|nr:LLM class F420-dependent oxidoreductase [Chloroflexota bacterium]
MKVGVIFPQTEIGIDPMVVRDYAQAVEQMGFAHLASYDHVLGVDPSSRPGWRGPYTKDTVFHEPLVLFGYLAGLTTTIELVTAIIILPQRQTALVAKQAAEVDVLSQGRLRFGVGLGWNEAEYEGLGQNFHVRGQRVVEQIAVLRALWTNEVVDFEGCWDRITGAGINPLPIQRPIPIWMGGGGNETNRIEPALKRIAKIADGWFPQMQPNDDARATLEAVRGYVREGGRDPSALGIEARVSVGRGDPEEWVGRFNAWDELGATHLSVNTMGGGFTRLAEHLSALERFKEATLR